jgi:hypothetical protein
MRGAVLSILAGGALAFSATAASAATQITGTISTNGYLIASPTNQDISQATSLDFTDITNTPSPGVAGTLSSYSAGTGTFAGTFCGTGTCGSIQDIASLTVGAQSIPLFFVLTGGNNANPITFDLTGITSITRSQTGYLDVTATGIFNWLGYDSTPGTFFFSTQGTNITSFSATAAAVPEPATWGLMLLGFGAIGLAMRRRRRPVLAQVA